MLQKPNSTCYNGEQLCCSQVSVLFRKGLPSLKNASLARMTMSSRQKRPCVYGHQIKALVNNTFGAHALRCPGMPLLVMSNAKATFSGKASSTGSISQSLWK